MRRATAALSAFALLTVAACDRGPAPAPRLSEDGGTVRVVEQGFTTGATRTGRPFVSYGFVLQNTSRSRAVRSMVVDVRFRTAAGDSVTDYIVSPKRTVNIPLRPGQRAGVGWNSRVDNAGTTRVTVRVLRVSWTGSAISPGLTADTVSVAPPAISFTVHSQYPSVLTRIWADVLYRNANGRIVGGTNSRLSGRWISSSYAPGESAGRMVDELGPPPGTDLAHTDVYLHPDPA
jgi:hypothetical protein